MTIETKLFRLPGQGQLSLPTSCLLNNACKVTVPRPVRERTGILDGGVVEMFDLGTGVMMTFKHYEVEYYRSMGLPPFDSGVVSNLGLVALPNDLLPKWNMGINQTISFVDLLGPIAYFADENSAKQARAFMNTISPIPHDYNA